jgi:RNA polymerase sigma-70 factor (ECF subfamily)
MPILPSKNNTLVEPDTAPMDFIALYRQYVLRIYRYVMARVGDRVEAEDLTSQVFLEALKEADRLMDIKNLPAWLFTIARNKVVDSYRRDKDEASIEEIAEPAAEHGDLLAQVIASEKSDELHCVLKRLPPDQLELLQLRYAGGLSYRQIGESTGKSEAAVKMSIHRLLDKLQVDMERQDE